MMPHSLGYRTERQSATASGTAGSWPTRACASVPTTARRRPSPPPHPSPPPPPGPASGVSRPPRTPPPTRPAGPPRHPSGSRAPSPSLPPPPPSLQSQQWVDAFNEVKSLGAASSVTRTPDQTAVAIFWTANVVRQYNILARSIATSESLDVPETARLIAMVNEVGADAMIAMMNAKYHYLFWRPVTAIDPSSATNDGVRPVPGLPNGNPLTAY